MFVHRKKITYFLIYESIKSNDTSPLSRTYSFEYYCVSFMFKMAQKWANCEYVALTAKQELKI